MYKVFINDKPLFFLSSLEGIAVSEGVGIMEYDPTLVLDDFFDYHDHNMSTLVLGSKTDWKNFCTLFLPIKAAGGLVRNKEEFLFIYRNDKWDLPKGKMEHGEMPEEAAVREVMEECGIEVPELLNMLIETYHTYFHNGNWMLKQTYWYLMEYSGDRTLTPQLEEGITKAEWISMQHWSRVMMNTYGSIQDVLDAYN